MGIVNVTPDSFSDGGQFAETDAAVALGKKLMDDGADIIDVGGESTRPGATPVPEDEEIARVIPVIERLVKCGATVSVDTMHANVARQAIKAGASIVNDVSGGLADPEMISTIVQTGVIYIAGHYRGPAGGPDRHANPITEVVQELAERRAALLQAGVKPDKLILDPGLGFGKGADSNWAILRGLPQLTELGQPVMVGASRKRFLRESCISLDQGTAAVSALAAANGAWAVRVHNVAASRDAIAVATAWKQPTEAKAK